MAVSFSSQVMLSAADALREMGKWRQAAEVYRRVLADDPDNAKALYNLGLLLWIYCDQPDDAAACFTRLLQRLPDDGEAIAALAFVRSDQGMQDEAISLMERAARHDLSARTLTQVGGLQRQVGEIE